MAIYPDMSRPPLDPRDRLESGTRAELFRLAQKYDVKEITHYAGPGMMPKMVMLRFLRARGIRGEEIPYRSVYADRGAQAPSQPADVTVDPTEDLMRQMQAPEPKPMKMHELRSECKRRGIKTSRKDTADILRAKLNGQDTTPSGE